MLPVLGVNEAEVLSVHVHPFLLLAGVAVLFPVNVLEVGKRRPEQGDVTCDSCYLGLFLNLCSPSFYPNVCLFVCLFFVHPSLFVFSLSVCPSVCNLKLGHNGHW